MSRLLRSIKAAWLRWCLQCNESYARDCERVGIYGTETMAEWRKQADATRVQIALLERA